MCLFSFIFTILSFIFFFLADIRPKSSSPLLIHFDGWGAEYDYWATVDSDDLHPIGHQHANKMMLHKPNGQYAQEEFSVLTFCVCFLWVG
jgi:hypothetical protein